jgi:DNA-binding PadR family transcriptional regulator
MPPTNNDPQLLVLVSLASGPKHGHAIMLDIERIAGTRLGPGTLYGAISRLETAGQIEPMPAAGRRRPYRLTGTGRGALAARLRALRATVEAGLARIGHEPVA